MSVQLNSSPCSCVWEHTTGSASEQFIFQAQQHPAGTSLAPGWPGCGEQPGDSAVPEAVFAAVCHLGVTVDPGKSPLQGSLWTRHCGIGFLRQTCPPWLIHLTSGSMAFSWARSCSRRELLYLPVCALCGRFQTFPRNGSRSFPSPCKPEVHEAWKKKSQCLCGQWEKFPSLFSSLKHSPETRIRVSYPSTLMIPSRLDMPFGVLLIHLFGIVCLHCLCLDCPRSLTLPRAMPIISTPAFLAASSSVFP